MPPIAENLHWFNSSYQGSKLVSLKVFCGISLPPHRLMLKWFTLHCDDFSASFNLGQFTNILFLSLGRRLLKNLRGLGKGPFLKLLCQSGWFIQYSSIVMKLLGHIKVVWGVCTCVDGADLGLHVPQISVPNIFLCNLWHPDAPC